MAGALNIDFCIWGTGKYGRILMNQLKEYIPICRQVFCTNIFDHIKYFIDNDIEKQKLEFCGKQVKSPITFFSDHINFCVTAALNREEIHTALEEHGLKQGINYVSSETFIDALKKEIIKRRTEVVKRYNLQYLNEAKTINELLRLIKRALIQLSPGTIDLDHILKYVIFSFAVDWWKKSINKKEDFHVIRSYFDDAFIVAAFAWYYGNDITEIAECFYGRMKNSPFQCPSKQTIGIVIYNYFGGGIEKAIALLIPIYIKNGHKVVLITDSYAPDQEYDLPLEVIRYTMIHKMDGDLEGRLRELTEYAMKDNIDIMCFHSGYTQISTFYNIWQLKLQNIAVLMEVHSAFFPVLMEKKEVSQYYSYMYRLADRLIVLSSTDKVFWESLGCHCQYIQNPVGDISERDEYGSGGKYHETTNTIAWVGRLVQLSKQVLDIVPIMREVVKKIPDAKLKVVGLAASPRDYNSLIQMITRYNLENNIELCGYLPDISQVYEEADIVLMTSSSESFCNVIMESKICGTPIVMYELPWLELLKDGCGYVAVKQGDTKAAASAIVTLLKDNILRERMSINARKSIEPFLRQDVYLDWKHVFDEVMGGKEKEFAPCAEFSIIVNMLLKAVYESERKAFIWDEF